MDTIQRPLKRDEAITILQFYLKNEIMKLPWFQKIYSEVKGIVFYGSTAKGLNLPGSDLDILIFLPLATETEHTEGEYSYKYQGEEINIVLRSIEKMRELAANQDNAFQAEIFDECEILYEKDSELRTLIASIRNTSN